MAWSKTTRISIMLAIDIAFFCIELISGIAVHSLALMADAFHMLNDIISLIIGLWAVTVAKRATTHRFSYGFVRAEILGAFFNAVFLIALCVSIILEALTRLIEPQEVTNPKLILIVGCFGLASNLVGFVVLGGHGHDHGHGSDGDHGHEHVHEHQSVTAAEEGRSNPVGVFADDQGPVGDVFPEVAVARAQQGALSPEATRRIRFGDTDDSHNKRGSPSRDRGGRRRTSSLRHSRFTSIDDLSIHPASFRQDIIDHSRSTPDDGGVDDDGDEGSSGDDYTPKRSIRGESAMDENTPLLGNGNNEGHNSGDKAPRTHQTMFRTRRDSGVHDNHHHAKPRSKSKGQQGHSHNHADMGMNAMVLHVLGDALGNVGVIATALVIWLTDWPGRFYADPAVSLFITLIILRSAIPLTKATSKVLLQATPDHIEIQDIKDDIQNLDGVISCHHVHIWQLSDTKVVASLHIQVAFPIIDEGGEKYMKLAKQARKCLHAYGIHSATIQPEFCLDQNCNHQDEATVATLDGSASPRQSASNPEPGDGCLLECVDDCVNPGCCGDSLSQSASKAGSSRRSSHSLTGGHGHGDHSHGH
ncbi:cation efflux protein [Poronia punctata]|nr:cation efflux protein [Poronia punctata]